MDSYDDNDFDDVNESKKQIERNRNRREQRRLKNALRSKDIDAMMDMDETYYCHIIQ